MKKENIKLEKKIRRSEKKKVTGLDVEREVKSKGTGNEEIEEFSISYYGQKEEKDK